MFMTTDSLYQKIEVALIFVTTFNFGTTRMIRMVLEEIKEQLEWKRVTADYFGSEKTG